MTKGKKLFVLSNRLPVSMEKVDSMWKFTMSSGGLVSALTGLKMDFTWIGTIGNDISLSEREELQDLLLKEHSCIPIFVDENTYSSYYDGFSNGALWPLFHYLPQECTFSEDDFLSYQKVNQTFLERLIPLLEDGDQVWIHDYHLFLLPALLREWVAGSNKKGAIKIGFFLHIPFPTSEIYRYLPQRREILLGMLGCDLLGFQTYDYARHFISSCNRLLSLKSDPSSIALSDRTVKIRCFPIGITPEKWLDALLIPLHSSDAKSDSSQPNDQQLNNQQQQIQERIKSLKEEFGGLKIILGVDRLDYIKGLTFKLHSFNKLLKDNPSLVGKVVLLQIAIPSRQTVKEYRDLRSVINELIGRINGRFGSPSYTPIHYIFQSLPFEELISLYRVADVLVISSMRDGMNLVSMEYVVCQKNQGGVLVISEFCGCSPSMHGAIIHNPWSIDDLSSAMLKALEMDILKAKHAQRTLESYVTKYTAKKWGESFIKELCD